MRELTDDERAMYRALRDTFKFADHAERMKRQEVREAIDAMHQKKGPGPSVSMLTELDSLGQLRHAAESDFDAFLRSIFD